MSLIDEQVSSCRDVETGNVGVWLRLLAIFSLFLLGLARTAPSTVHHDLWHQMALARQSVAIGRVPLDDSFAYTATIRPVVHHEWGAGMVGLVLTRLGGGSALVLFNVLILASITTLLSMRLAANRTPLLLAAVASIVPLGFGVVSFMPIIARTYSVLACSLLLLLLKFDGQGRRAWVLPWLLVCVLWVNLHGGIVVGFAMVGAHAVECVLHREPWKHLLLALIGMVGAMYCTPYGLAYYSYIVRAITMPRPIITEWDPAWLVSEFGLDQVFFVASFVIACFVCWRMGWKRCRGSVMLLVLALACVRAEKMVIFYGITWLVTLPLWIANSDFS